MGAPIRVPKLSSHRSSGAGASKVASPRVWGCPDPGIIAIIATLIEKVHSRALLMLASWTSANTAGVDRRVNADRRRPFRGGSAERQRDYRRSARAAGI